MLNNTDMMSSTAFCPVCRQPKEGMTFATKNSAESNNDQRC